MQNLALLIAIGLPVLVILLLRSDAPVVFLSLCAGALLVQYAGGDTQLASKAAANSNVVVEQYFQLGLLLAPVVLTTFLLRKTMKPGNFIFSLLPAIGVGLVGVLLAVPLLPNAVSDAITKTSGWAMLQENKEVVVAASIVASLVALWVAHLSAKAAKKRHHRG